MVAVLAATHDFPTSSIKMGKRLAMIGLRWNQVISAAFIAAACFVVAPRASASVVVDGTRVVYLAAKREVTIRVRNAGDAPSLVQAWLDTGDPHSKPGESKVPFVLTPPLFRLDPTKVQSLRLVYTHDPLPEDHESLFWLNVLDIPPRTAANPDLPNQLELAFKHRMKVFFRPAHLPGSAADAPGQLSWKLVSENGRLVAIEVSNPTAFHVSLTQLIATAQGHSVTIKADMVDPSASRRFDLPDPVAAPVGAVAIQYWFVNDYGGNVEASAAASSVR